MAPKMYPDSGGESEGGGQGAAQADPVRAVGHEDGDERGQPVGRHREGHPSECRRKGGTGGFGGWGGAMIVMIHEHRIKPPTQKT